MSSAHAFLQALAFMQQSMGEPPPVALSALLRIDAGGYSQASHAAASWVAALWGLLRTAAVEHPNVRWTALSVDALAPHADTVQARHSEHQAALACLTCNQSLLAIVGTVLPCTAAKDLASASYDRLPVGPDPSRLSQDCDDAAVTGVFGDALDRGTYAEARLLACAACCAAHPVQLRPQPRGSLAALAAVPLLHGCLKDDQARMQYLCDCSPTVQSA